MVRSVARLRIVISGVLAVALGGAAARAQSETLTATATVKTGTPSALTVVVERFATEAERDELLESIERGGTPLARVTLLRRQDAGLLRLGAGQAAIKYAYARHTDRGRLVTIVTTDPIARAASGDGRAEAFGVGLVVLKLTADGSGHGELIVAARVRVDDDGAIVTDGGSPHTIQLSNVTRK
jgi:hypothetical protein